MNINTIAPNNPVFNNFYTINNNSQKYSSTPQNKKIDSVILASTIIGSLIPILLIRKYQGKTFDITTLKGLDAKSKVNAILKSFKINYDLKEMLLCSTGSITGGLFGGLLFNKNENKKSKIKESIFQFNNIAIPTSIVAGLLKLINKSKSPNKGSLKIVSILAGIIIGMPLAATVSNNINNKIIDKDNQNVRKLKLKDCFVHVDDLLGGLVLAKIPFADKLHVEQALPIFYGICGYEAGTKK